MKDFNMLLPQLKKYHQFFSYLFIAMIVIGGGVVNLKFIQLGIPEFGLVILKLDEIFVIISIFLLGLSACISCITTGLLMDKFKVSFNQKKILFIFISISNFLLIFLTYLVSNQIGYFLWVISFGIDLGILSGISFSFLFYLIPQKKRGIVAAILGGTMYFIGASMPGDWSFEIFRNQNIMMLPVMAIVLGFFLIFDVFDTDKIEKNINLKPKYQYNFKTILIVLFLILFIDSFGFLRILGNPIIVANTWQSTNIFRIYIGILHLSSALIIGFFYEKLKFFYTSLISLILFVIADFIIGYFLFSEVIQYIFPCFYASAVSVYTIILMSIFADISTLDNINRNMSIGFGILGLFCTYLATSISLYLDYISFPFNIHLLIASSIALISIFAVIFIKLKKKYNK